MVFKKMLLSSLILNFGLLLGRLSGFARETFMAITYGATAEADIAVLMLTVPDLLVNILMGGALGAVLIPEFTQRPDQARQLLYQSLLFFGVVFTGVTAVLYWQTGLLVSLLVPGFEQAQAAKASVALGWVIWLVPLTVLTGGVTAYLQAQNRFAVAALGTLIINSSIILGLILVYYECGSLSLLAIFVLTGGVLRLFSQVLIVRPGWRPLLSLFPNQLNKALLIRYAQVMLSGSVLLLFPVVARGLSSYEETGSVAIFNFATRLIQFPLSIAVTFLVVIFFPKLSQSFSEDRILHHQLIRYGVQITLGLSIVAAITLIFFSDAYAQLVYGHGNMQNTSLAMISALTSIGLLSLPLQGFSNFLTAVFNSRKDTLTPLILNGIGLAFFLLVSKAGVFGKGLLSLMWGMVVSYGLICILQIIFLKIEAFSLRHVILDRSFLTGIVCATVLLAFANSWIGKAGLPAWVSLLLAGFVALMSLSVIALFNDNLRNNLRVWANNK